MMRKIVGVVQSMNDKETTIDFKFGLSQLSGNQDLLIKLLVKFQSQYVDVADKLDCLLAADDITTAKDVIHTLKGVSGNLGLKALHIDSKILETSLSTGVDKRSAILTFKSTLVKTLDEITSLSNKTNPIESEENHGLNQLKNALQRNEYVPPEKIVSCLSQTTFNESDKNQITQAIEELDYPKALALLKSN